MWRARSWATGMHATCNPHAPFQGVWATLGHGGPRESSGCSKVLPQSSGGLAGPYTPGLACGQGAQGLCLCDPAGIRIGEQQPRFGERQGQRIGPNRDKNRSRKTGH